MSKSRPAGRSSDRSRANDTKRPRLGRWLAVVGVLSVGVILAAALVVGATRPDSAADGHEPRRAPVAAEAFPIVAYQGADILGAEELDFHRLLGTGTPVVLNFWAGQCPPCRAEMPDFQRVYDEYAGDFLLVGVDIGPFIGLGSRESAERLLEELDITYPTAYAVDARAVRDNNVLGMPTTIFYDGTGAEVDRHSGLLSREAFEARVRELIREAR